MADHFYGTSIGVGADPKAGVAGIGVTEGTSTTGLVIELRLNDGAGLERQMVLDALEMLKNHFQNPDTIITP